MLNNKPNIKPFVLLTLLIIVIVAVVTAAALYISRNQIVNSPASVSNPISFPVSLPVSNVVSEPVSSVVSIPTVNIPGYTNSSSLIAESIPQFDYANYASYTNPEFGISFKAPTDFTVLQKTEPAIIVKNSDGSTYNYVAYALKDETKDVTTAPLITFSKDGQRYLKFFIAQDSDGGSSDGFTIEYSITTAKSIYKLINNGGSSYELALYGKSGGKSIWKRFDIEYLDYSYDSHKATKIPYTMFKSLVSIIDSIEPLN